MEKIEAFIFTIKDRNQDLVPDVILVIEDTIIAKGNWMSFIERYIEGILYGLELANYEVEKIEKNIMSKDLKKSPDPVKLKTYV